MMLAGNVHTGPTPTPKRMEGTNAVVKFSDQHHINDCASVTSKSTVESSESKQASAGLTTAECHRAQFRSWMLGDSSKRGSSRERYLAQMIRTDPIVHQGPASRSSFTPSAVVLSGNWLDVAHMTAKSRGDLSSRVSLRKCSSTPSLARRNVHVIPDGPGKEELETGCQRAHYMHHNRSSPNLWRQLPKYAGNLSGTMSTNTEPQPKLRRSASHERYQSQMSGSSQRRPPIAESNQLGSYRSLEQAPDGRPEGKLHSWVASRYMLQQQYLSEPFFDDAKVQHRAPSNPVHDRHAAVDGAARYAARTKMDQYGADVMRKGMHLAEPRKFEPPPRILQREMPAPRSTALEKPSMQGSNPGNIIPENRRRIMHSLRSSAREDAPKDVHRVVSQLSIGERNSVGRRLNSKSSCDRIILRTPWKF